MEPKVDLVRPATFEQGREYYWLERQTNGVKAIPVPVRFTAYDPCPAFVIVSTEMGRKWRCPRDAVLSK